MVEAERRRSVCRRKDPPAGGRKPQTLLQGW